MWWFWLDMIYIISKCILYIIIYIIMQNIFLLKNIYILKNSSFLKIISISFPKTFILFVIIWSICEMRTWGQVCLHGAEDTFQELVLSFHHGFLDSNSDCQTMWQVLLPTEPLRRQPRNLLRCLLYHVNHSNTLLK